MTEENSNQKRVAVVTGASRGIGAAIATSLVNAGYAVAGLSTSGTAPEGALAVACDVASSDSVDEALTAVEEQLGAPTIVVANAGINKDTLMLRMSEDDWSRVIDVNLTGTYRLIKRAIRPMMRAKYGRIVAISSVVALTGSAGQVNYAASKSGLIGMMRSVSRELGSRNITANVVAPGFIETDMTDVLDDDIKKQYLDGIPAKRAGTVDDVAAAVRYLVSEEAGYVTGAVLPVDGGLGMGH